MWRQSANHSLSLWWSLKTTPWEFPTKLLHCFFTNNNKSNLHFTRAAREVSLKRKGSCVPSRRFTARSVEDETRNAELNGNQNPECWGNFSQLQIQINKNLNLNLYREIPRNSNPIKISIRLCTVRYREIWFSRFWQVDLKYPQHLGFRLPFNSAFRVSSSTERAVSPPTGGLPFGSGKPPLSKIWRARSTT